jgi:acid stress chaperone HdeA
MIREISLVTALLSLSAAAAPETGTTSSKVKPSKITCEEFVVLDETVKPQVIYFIEGATRKGKMEDAVISVDEISNPVLWVLDECRKTPKATVWQKVENWVKKEYKKL